MNDQVDFLGQLSIFRELYEDELEALAHIATEYEFDDGAVIAYQRDVANSMYIVRSGRLFAQTVDKYGRVRASRSFLPGQYFGAHWLFAPETHPATVKGAGNGRLLIIESSDFLRFLDNYPGVLEALEPIVDEFTDEVVAGLSERAWKEAQKYRARAERESAAINLLSNELVEYRARRSLKYLVLTELLPVLGLLILSPLSYFLLTGRGEGIINTVAIAIPVLLTLIFLAIIAFQLLDWYLDYFVITNKHLTHREFDLRGFRIFVNKIPIHQIQSVATVQPNIITKLLDIGTARITTAATAGTVFFDNIDDPAQVEETLNRLTRQVRALSEAESQATMRQSLEEYFEVPRSYRPVASEEETADLQEATPPGPNILEAFLRRYKWRVEENGIVTYRKHFFVLLRETAYPALLALFSALIALVLIRLFGFPANQLSVAFIALFALDTLWLIWEVEDWRNDTFQVTDRFVIDIDRRPFGFGESRKQAPLANIQNVNADRPGLIPTLFNYGFVHVETAGAESDIRFENVSNPSQIQSDIFRQLDRFRRQQSVREGEQRRKEYAVLLDVYQQASEQGRIPRRTPRDVDPEEIEPMGLEDL